MSDNNDKWDYLVAQKQTTTLFDKSVCKVLMQLPLPGVVILVHGVNSDGEWFEQAEQGLCKGLNARLARKDEQLCHAGIEAGQLAPAAYMAELTSSGFIDPERNADTFLRPEPNYSPVIRFRWGYKANADELREFGKNVWLNEDNYWGGGPFANGCSSLPDLWGDGLNDRLFLWLTAQHLNPTSNRDVYRCPPRAYYVHAAWRLTRLVELIRSKQADIPITIVCHSQGNMVSMAAAFLGEQLPEVTDRSGKSGKAVADCYVLCNPPYSLRADDMGMDNWAQRGQANAAGELGRESGKARLGTLKNFLQILRKRAELEQPADDIDRRGANAAPQDGSTGYTAAGDRARYGWNNATKGRVTLYCNPADQVISASTVQGIGWMGVSRDQLAALGANGVFTQRVWAQGREVGGKGVYRYWGDHWKKPVPGSADFWWPPSPNAKYSINKGLASNQSFIAKLGTLASAPVMYLVTALVKVPINALPPKNWEIPVEAPELPKGFLPTPRNFGGEGDAASFDQGKDPAAVQRNKDKSERDPSDPYDAYQGSGKDAAQGDAQSEAQLRYEDRARLRMMARREGKVDAQDKVPGEEANAQPAPEWVAWRNEQIARFLKESIDENATDHSTILTNPAHSEKALAYDVAVGYSLLSPADWLELRKVADWRLVGTVNGGSHPHAIFGEYNKKGTLDGERLHLHKDYQLKAMPETIMDEREIKPASAFREGAYHG